MEVADAVIDGKDEIVMGIWHLHGNAEAESGTLGGGQGRQGAGVKAGQEDTLVRAVPWRHNELGKRLSVAHVQGQRTRGRGNASKLGGGGCGRGGWQHWICKTSGYQNEGGSPKHSLVCRERFRVLMKDYAKKMVTEEKSNE